MHYLTLIWSENWVLLAMPAGAAVVGYVGPLLRGGRHEFS
ncbi:hypothetical protein J2776_002813 [Paraburkholderia caledonica]|uniref:Uncharacterized protein n=1 Tax=Paraburkholderia caledonica TaxID=134536 RepID=A0ABU1KYR4_9BURK|nr:hypothetical protein [Paraburkholderia caledonica]